MSIARLLAIVGINVVLTPVLVMGLFFFIAVSLGPAMTSHAANPPVNAADFDTALALPMALCGLALAAVSLAVVRIGAPRTGPVAVPETP